MKADAVICGEIRHHEALELTAAGVRVVQAGHHGTERFFVNLAGRWINERYPDAKILSVGFDDPPIEVIHGGNAHNGV
jgi:putative NIF3 family GTP cyclohydrolase 1 type 2